MSTTHCHPCLKRGKHSAVYSVCYQCREFYCKACSDMHPTFKMSQDHIIFKLLLPAITPSVNNEDECASDFLKTEYDDPPYAAQVALGSRRDEGQSKRAALPRSDKKSTQHADPGNLKAVHCRDISVKRSEDKYGADVRGVLTVAGKVVVVDNKNKMLKLFDDSGTYLSSTALKDSTWGITRVSDDTLATCGGNKVYLWNIHGQTVTCSDVTYHVNYDADGIHYNQTYYCVLHSNDHAITILGRQGGHVRHITVKEACGKKITFGYDIYMDQKSHAIYVPCQDDNSGVLCVSVEGEVLWFTPLSGSLWGITEILGVLCVADYGGDCLHLLSTSGRYERKLLEKSDMNDRPYNIYYDGQGEKLYVNFYDDTDEREVISVYSITCQPV